MTEATPDYDTWREPDHQTDTILDLQVPGFPNTLSEALPHDYPPITMRRGGLRWPVAPTTKDASERFEDEEEGRERRLVAPTAEGAAGDMPTPRFEPELAYANLKKRWVAPTETLGLDGEPLVEPEAPLPEKADIKELPAWASELQYWWTATASSDIGGSIQKIVAYGGRGAAYDLIATGHDLAALNGRTVGDEEAAELAVVFYLSSKVNRMLAAAIDGRRGSDDTALDITFYSLMLRRIRAVGGWPVRNDKEIPTA